MKNSLNVSRDFQGGDPTAHTTQGEETWYRVMFRFPAGNYHPTSGDFNIHVQWHSCSTCAGIPTGSYNSFIGVRCSSTPGVGCRVFFDLRSGKMSSSGSPAINTAIDPLPAGSLLYDHWYDSVIRIRWKPDNTGQFTWYLDGRKIAENLAVPTLLVGPTGVVDRPDFDILNYRRDDVTSTSYTDFALAAWGPSAASVGFTP
jgi:hypothetical protein